MIPLRDLNPSSRFPVVTIILIAVNVVVHLMNLGMNEKQTLVFYQQFALIPSELTYSLVKGDLPRFFGAVPNIFTSMFLHGGWMHLIGNMWFLWLFGDNVEDRLGHFRYLLFYIGCGLAAALTHILTGPASPVPTVGASGAISGVMGAYVLLYPKARIVVLFWIFIFIRFIPVPAWLFLGFWFMLQLFEGMAGLGAQAVGGVAFWAHIGGFVAGVLLILPFRQKKPVVRAWVER